MSFFYKFIIKLLLLGNSTEWKTKWSLTNSMLFTLTTLTLIGYGHIAPRYSSIGKFSIFRCLLLSGLEERGKMIWNNKINS